VAFEPKPVQRPHPPVSIGGDCPPALRRAARHDGWIGLNRSAETVRAPVQTLAELRSAAGLTRPFTITVGATVAGDADVEALSGAGVDRLIVSPWARTREVPDALTAFARRFLG
jgi:alkanesulfonate monooxygenase SsuD/methylene tetrahydromethanopterin reductase-like flavin-dependent oxidoreductase (luciferase family)